MNQNQLKWVGGSDENLAALYSRAKALVSPSFNKGFGIPPLEAMSFKCQAVCSNGGSIPEIVGDSGEFFALLNPAGILQAISRVTHDESNSKALQLKSTEQIKNLFVVKVRQGNL